MTACNNVKTELGICVDIVDDNEAIIIYNDGSSSDGTIVGRVIISPENKIILFYGGVEEPSLTLKVTQDDDEEYLLVQDWIQEGNERTKPLIGNRDADDEIANMMEHSIAYLFRTKQLTEGAINQMAEICDQDSRLCSFDKRLVIQERARGSRPDDDPDNGEIYSKQLDVLSELISILRTF